MVEVTNPRLGEQILDPAAGTGGFLVESFLHLEKQCRTVEHRQILQKRSIYGVEAKPMPYLLAQMNLLLHGLESPDIDPMNALRFPLVEIGEKDRIDVVLTNPPFGGEEERGIQANFPDDKQTAETALLFLQLIMRKLRRQPKPSFPPARAAVVVPNGTPFRDGVCARIKEELLTEFNLHTIVRLPNGVFAPYTDIPTNILFFDRLGPTKDIWYYEHPVPEGRKNTRGVGARRERTRPEQFLNIEIPMPDIGQQEWAETLFAGIDAVSRLQTEVRAELDAMLTSIVVRTFEDALSVEASPQSTNASSSTRAA